MANHISCTGYNSFLYSGAFLLPRDSLFMSPLISLMVSRCVLKMISWQSILGLTSSICLIMGSVTFSEMSVGGSQISPIYCSLFCQTSRP